MASLGTTIMNICSWLVGYFGRQVDTVDTPQPPPTPPPPSIPPPPSTPPPLPPSELKINECRPLLRVEDILRGEYSSAILRLIAFYGNTYSMNQKPDETQHNYIRRLLWALCPNMTFDKVDEAFEIWQRIAVLMMRGCEDVNHHEYLFLQLTTFYPTRQCNHCINEMGRDTYRYWFNHGIEQLIQVLLNLCPTYKLKSPENRLFELMHLTRP